LRAGVLRVLLGRSEWCLQLLEAIEQGRLPAAQLSPSDRQTLLGHSRASLREWAQRLFSVQSDRRELFSRYSQALETDGDKAKGKALFQLNCAPCHRLHGEGVNVGPDLGMVLNKSRRELLAAILDPNQAVEIRYAGYTAITRSDREISGIIVEETAGSVTLRSAGGVEETIVRTELKELAGSGLSLMPEGFEAVISPTELADLIAFLTGTD
jgi:putative heme-binding domain-containing protein